MRAGYLTGALSGLMWLLWIAKQIHVIGICLLSQSADEKHNHEKKPTHLCAPRKFPPKMCLPCFIIMQSCYCDYRINKTFLCSRCLICVLHSGHFISTYYARKGFLAFFIVITHKSTGSENLITWCVCARTDCFCLCPDAFTELCGGTKGFKVVETFTGPRITGEATLQKWNTAHYWERQIYSRNARYGGH